MPRIDLVQSSPTDTGVPHQLTEIGMTLDEMKALSRQILVAIPYRAKEGINSGICIHYGLWGPLGVKVVHVSDPHGGFIEIVRCGIVRIFLDSCKTFPELRYLIMIDNDESVDSDCLLRLARHDLPVVTGVVCSASEKKGVFACFTVKTPSGAAYFPTLSTTGKMPAEGVVEVYQAGTGLICIRRDVLETLQSYGELPFYIPEHVRRNAATTGDLQRSEDISFSDTCEKYGIKRYADLSVRAIHYKQLALSWPQEGIDATLRAEDWVVKPHDHEEL